MITSFEKLKNECEKCRNCELYKTRTNVVFGIGNPKSKVMFIGEGPGQNEDLKGEPFIGRGGILLDKYLKSIDLDRNENIYITNIVKCRPPKNRDPLPCEQEECIKWLREQVKIIKPKIIVCLGRVAAQKLIYPDFKVTVEHGKFIEKGGILFMGTFHPAALLRNSNHKPAALEDFLLLRDKLSTL